MYQPTDYDRTTALREWESYLLDPLGKAMMRRILSEQSKGDEGDVPGVKKFLHDMLEQTINKLYGAPRPTNS